MTCTNSNCDYQSKQCFVYRRELLNALRSYLVQHKSNHTIELKYVNWMYRNVESDVYKITSMSENEKENARKALKEKGLYGLFHYIFLTENSSITYWDAKRFMETFQKVKPFMKDKFFLDYEIIDHVLQGNHDLQCW